MQTWRPTYKQPRNFRGAFKIVRKLLSQFADPFSRRLHPLILHFLMCSWSLLKPIGPYTRIRHLQNYWSLQFECALSCHCNESNCLIIGNINNILGAALHHASETWHSCFAHCHLKVSETYLLQFCYVEEFYGSINPVPEVQISPLHMSSNSTWDSLAWI